MVVTVPVSMRRRMLKFFRSTPRASVLLAGIASLPTQSGSISLLPPGAQLRAIEGVPKVPQPDAIEPYGNFLPPAGGLEPALTFGFGWSLTGLADALGVDPIVSASLNGTVSDAADQFGVLGSATGPAATVGAAAPPATRTLCEQLPPQLQAFGEYWNNHSAGGRPVQLAANLSTDPTQDPSGDPSNLPRQGSAGAWCRPSPVPFADSSPLASRTFWTPIILVLCAIAVLWLSRGVGLPR